MKKNISRILPHLTAFSVLVALFITPSLVTAQKFTNPIDSQTLDGFLLKLLDVIILLGAIAVVFFIILAGYKYVTARGDEGEIKSAHQILTWTLVGAAIILGARVIASAIQATVNELTV